MAAPLVHMLVTPCTFKTVAIADPISAQFDEGGNVNEYTNIDSTDVELVGVDRRAQTVVVNTQGYDNVNEIGDAGALVLTMKARAEGKGTTGTAITKTFSKAVVVNKSAGPVIEGTPTYNITFRCHA